MMAGQFVGPCRLAARHGTTSSNPISSNGESTANLPRTAVGAVMLLAGKEAWPIDIIASELSQRQAERGSSVLDDRARPRRPGIPPTWTSSAKEPVRCDP